MDRKIIATELYKIAKELLADTDYIYDPEHKKHPSGGYTKTEKGWTKNKRDEHGEKPSGDSKKTSPKTEMTDEQKKLDYKSNDKDWGIRYSVSENKNTASETLDKLSNDEVETVRKNVAEHPNTSHKTLKKMLNDGSDAVKESAKKNIALKETGFDTKKIGPNLHHAIYNKMNFEEVNEICDFLKKKIIFNSGGMDLGPYNRQK